jgi:hypothetical protein
MVQLRASDPMAYIGRHRKQPQMPNWIAPLLRARQDNQNGHMYLKN